MKHMAVILINQSTVDVWRWPEDVCAPLVTAMTWFIKATQCWLSSPSPHQTHCNYRHLTYLPGAAALDRVLCLCASSPEVRDFDVSWFVTTNRVETTWLVIRLPPSPAVAQITVSPVMVCLLLSWIAFVRCSWQFYRSQLITNIENLV